MAVSVKVRDDTGAYVDITDHVRLFNADDESPLLELTENAEEGSTAMNRLELDDLSVALAISGHRGVVVAESSVASGETGVFRGYTADRGHLPNERISAQGRTIAMNVADINSIFDRRILVGGGAKRPNETDVARITWAMAQNEAGLIDSDAWLSSSNPKNMDDADYRKRTLGDVFNDCAQASGKNWGLTYDFSTGDGFQLWYGRDELSVYDSGCTLTNDPTAVDDSTTFLIGDETNIMLDPARVYSGIGVEYKHGFVYRQRASTAAAFARRDALMQAPHCKTKAKAIDRAQGYLDRHDTEELRIETYIYVSAANANKIRPFHRVTFQSDMSASTSSPIYCRVLRRTMTYWKPAVWRVALTLIGMGSAAEPATPSLVEAKGVAATSLNWDDDPTSGQLMVALQTKRDSPLSPDVPVALYGPWTEIGNARTDAGSLHQASMAAYRVAGSSDGDEVNWGGSSTRSTLAAFKFASGATVSAYFTEAVAHGAATMTVSDIVVPSDGYIVAAIRIHNFDTPPPHPTLTPPSGFTEVVSSKGEGNFDFGSSGYVAKSAGTYSLTWTSDNSSPAGDWHYTIIAVVVVA